MGDLPVDKVSYEVRGRGAWITIDRPRKLNALDRHTVEQLVAAVERGLADDDVRALVITGGGEKAFVAGADIGEMANLHPAGARDLSLFLQASLDRIEQARKPVLAAVNGFALGGGCELAMACHVRIAAEQARFGQPEVSLGLIPGAGGTQRLARLVGRGRALDLILSGATIDAVEAHRIGLADRIVPAGELRPAVEAYVEALAAKAPLALELAIEAVIAGGECSLAEAQRLEASLFGMCFSSEDMREGTRAFLEKRKPSFQGR